MLAAEARVLPRVASKLSYLSPAGSFTKFLWGLIALMPLSYASSSFEVRPALLKILRQFFSSFLFAFASFACGEDGEFDQTKQPETAATEEAKRTSSSYGSTNPEDLPPILQGTALNQWASRHHIRSFGWLDGGYTYSSAGDGHLKIAPEPNRFGNEAIFNAAYLAFEHPMQPKGWSLGYRADFFTGADAARLRAMNSFGPQGKRLGTDLRQAFVNIHAPILTKGGVDFQAGRMNMPIGFEPIAGPYRNFYSQSYFWVSYQVVATAATATVHVTPSLDLLAGAAMGFNTVFKLRGRAPAYIARATYRPGTGNKTTLLATVFTGPKPAPTAPGHDGSWQTVTEGQVRRIWTSRFSQHFQGHAAWLTQDRKVNDTAPTYGFLATNNYHLSHKLDLNTRAEWYYDKYGARTSVPGHFGQTAFGLNIMPKTWINFRPEVRGDFAEQKAYGSVNSFNKRNQFSVAFDLIFKFSAVR